MSDPTDIVTRLRAVLHNDRSVELMNREAADIIERLRAESQNAYERTKTLTAERDALFVLTDRLTAERDALRAERDEARRMYCEEAFCHRFNERRFNERCVPSPISNARQIAHNMKWDCFKEDTDV